MISKDGTIYNTGDCIIIKVNQLAKKRIKYDNHTKKYNIQEEKFTNYGHIDGKRIILEYIGNGNFRDIISGIIFTIDPKDERIAQYGTAINCYEEEYEQSINATLDKALKYPLTITGPWELIDLGQLIELSEAKNPEILKKITTFDEKLIRSTIHSKESKKILNEELKKIEKKALEIIKEDYASMVSRVQETAESENEELENMVALANNFLGQINSSQKTLKK